MKYRLAQQIVNASTIDLEPRHAVAGLYIKIAVILAQRTPAVVDPDLRHTREDKFSDGIRPEGDARNVWKNIHPHKRKSSRLGLATRSKNQSVVFVRAFAF